MTTTTLHKRKKVFSFNSKVEDDEYTPRQRAIIDVRLAKAKGGEVHGPFNTAQELSIFLEQNVYNKK